MKDERCVLTLLMSLVQLCLDINRGVDHHESSVSFWWCFSSVCVFMWNDENTHRHTN